MPAKRLFFLIFTLTVTYASQMIIPMTLISYNNATEKAAGNILLLFDNRLRTIVFFFFN